MDRKIRLYTGPGGMELIDAALEYGLTGRKRLYIGKKVPRILRKAHTIYQSPYNNKYYYSIKDPNWESRYNDY